MFTPTSLSFTYTKESLYALSKLQYSLVHAKSKFIYQLVCLALIVAGVLAPIYEPIRMLMLMAGCLALPSMYFPVKMATDRVNAHYKGKLPAVSYRFNKYNFTRTVADTTEAFSYKTITQLVEYSTNFYLIDHHNNVFILPPKDLDNDRGLKHIKDHIAQETGLRWGPLKSVWSLSIYTLFPKLKR